MTRRWTPRLRLSVAVVFLFAFVGSGSAGLGQIGQPARADGTRVTATPAAHEPLRVALYGDSLAWEAGQPFLDAVTANERAVVRMRVFGGTAICDWLDQMQADATTWHPQAVVVEFSGNTYTPCMHSRTGAPLSPLARDAKYARDARRVVGIFAASGARLYFVSHPIPRGEDPSPTAESNHLNTIYATLAVRTPRMEFVDAGQAVEDGGRYSDTLPCLLDEPCTGGVGASGQRVNVVRAPDGVHFCPNGPSAVAGVTVPCLVWSSGAFRYGNAMAAPVLKDFGL